MSERVTWESCPYCRRPATVRLLNGKPVRFDCPADCSRTQARMAPAFAWSSGGTAQQRALFLEGVTDLGIDPRVTQAHDLAHRLVGGMGRRWSHTQGVARRAESIAASVPDRDRPALVAAAWLHDIGYAEPLKRCAFHPLDGALYLQETDWGAPVAGLVAHHSGARFVAAVRGLSHLMRLFDAAEYAVGPLADALTYADQTTGPDGRPMPVEDRFTEMLTRHGPHSPLAQVHSARAPAIRAAVRRTEQRLLAARTEAHTGGRTLSTVWK